MPVKTSKILIFATAAGMLPVGAHAASLTKTPAIMINGLADGATTQQNASGTLTVLGAGVTGINAGNITSGVLPAAQLPLATGTTVGGVLTGTAGTNQFQAGVNSSGAPIFAQPSFANLSGVATSAQLPVATSSAIGGVMIGTAPTNQFQTGTNSSGAPVFAQPSFSGLSGSLTSTQVPAVTVTDFTGDGTTTAFTLGATPAASTKVAAYVGGVYQNSTSFSVSGATLTFVAAPPNGVAIETKVGP